MFYSVTEPRKNVFFPIDFFTTWNLFFKTRWLAPCWPLKECSIAFQTWKLAAHPSYIYSLWSRHKDTPHLNSDVAKRTLNWWYQNHLPALHYYYSHWYVQNKTQSNASGLKYTFGKQICQIMWCGHIIGIWSSWEAVITITSLNTAKEETLHESCNLL